MEVPKRFLFPILGLVLAACACHGQTILNTTSRSCSNFPLGLKVENEAFVDTFAPWKNQCPAGKVIVGLWTQSPTRIMEDLKCCSSPVDQALSVMSLDLHHRDDGPSAPDQAWNLQCPDNHVMTGVMISKIPNLNPSKNHVSAMKCSLLINKRINYNECLRLDLSTSVSLVRDPSFLWSVECPVGAAVLGLHGSNGFQSLQYAKCCKIQDTPTLTTLPWTCPVAPDKLCGWSLSKHTSLSWKYISADQGKDHYLYLSQALNAGSATIDSPGYVAPNSPLCFRITYFLRLYALIRITMKSYDARRVATIDNIGVIATSTRSLSKKDFVIQPKSNFQISVEGERIKFIVSTVWISELAFVPMDRCNADRCTPPNSGCNQDEVCLPHGPGGYRKCIKRAVKTTSRPTGTGSVTVLVTSSPTRTPVFTPNGNRGGGGGGSGKTDGGGGEVKPKPGGGGDRGATGGKTANVNGQRSRAFEPWVYTAFGGVCGTLLVLFLVFAFLTYRKKRLIRNLDVDVNYLRPRTFSGSFLSDNNNSYVPEPTIQPTTSEIVSRAVDIELLPVPAVEMPADSQSINGTPPSHHYFEVEQETFDRKTSQSTLTLPLYGSSEDLDDLSDGDVFLEPPSNEQELCAQLDKEIDRKDLHILPDKQLGQGAFGYVHFGIWRRPDGCNKTVAIKSMKDSEVAEERIKFLQEAAIMKQFAHQNVVFMFGVVTKRYPPMIVLEYMENGNLRKFLSRVKRSRLKQGLQRIDRDLHKTFLRMAREIVAGMTYLAGMQFVHRDLAARNILLDENLVCKIGDFGLARDLIGCEHYISQGGQIPIKWTAPEAIEFRRYSTASDVWSFGVLLYEIWSVGRKPYEKWSNDEVIERVCHRGYRLPPPKDCPRVIYRLMIDCWHPDETKRPRFSQIKYCLAQNDDRLLGHEKHQDRQRSSSLNELALETITEETDVLQYTYCKTN